VLVDAKIVIERPEDGREGSMTPEDRAYLTEERLRELLAVKSGQRWSGKLAEWGRERIREQIYQRSYLDARVGEPVLRGREGELVADLEMHVVLGWKYRLRRLDFVGNEFTRDSLLRHAVRVTPGGFIDRNELERGEARLRRTGYFDRSSLEIIDAQRAGGLEDDAWKDARYEMVEAKTGRLGFSVGLSTSGGLFGSISFQKRNFDIARWPRSWDDLWSGRAFTGNGQTFDAVIAPGTETTTYGAGFTEPNLFGSEWALSLRGYRRLEFRDDYEADRLGYQVGLSRSLYRRRDDTLQVIAGLRWRQEQVEVFDLEPDATPGATLFEGYNPVHALRAYLTVKASDDLRRARTSFEAGTGLELLGTGLGGDIDAVLFDASVTQTWILAVDDEGRRRRLTLRGQLGWGQAQGDTPEIPPFERFYLGGNSFRGFENRGVGPHINGYPTGGEWMLAGTIEYQHPLFSDVVSGVVFMDIGTLGTSIDADDAWRARLTVGPGLRIKIPMFGEAPLALDFGFVILDEEEDQRQLFTFSVSRDF
jgi:outer membrane protein insertion porin family